MQGVLPLSLRQSACPLTPPVSRGRKAWTGGALPQLDLFIMVFLYPVLMFQIPRQGQQSVQLNMVFTLLTHERFTTNREGSHVLYTMLGKTVNNTFCCVHSIAQRCVVLYSKICHINCQTDFMILCLHSCESTPRTHSGLIQKQGLQSHNLSFAFTLKNSF